MIKVAVLLIGQPRYLTGKSYRSIKNFLIDKYDCTFYCHYWYDENNNLSISNWSRQNPDVKCDKNTENIIKELYNPIVYKYDEPFDKEEILNKYKNYNTSQKDTPYNIMSLYKSMKICSTLYKNDKNEKNYDFFVKLRYDGVIMSFPDLNNYKYNENDIIISNYHYGKPLLDLNTFVCKNEKTFLSIFDIYDYYDIICETAPAINDEEFMWEYFKLFKIPFVKVSEDILITALIQHFNYDMS
jgi:hypothetical protein